jgi:hypothetical protein
MTINSDGPHTPPKGFDLSRLTIKDQESSPEAVDEEPKSPAIEVVGATAEKGGEVEHVEEIFDDDIRCESKTTIAKGNKKLKKSGKGGRKH